MEGSMEYAHNVNSADQKVLANRSATDGRPSCAPSVGEQQASRRWLITAGEFCYINCVMSTHIPVALLFHTKRAALCSRSERFAMFASNCNLQSKQIIS